MTDTQTPREKHQSIKEVGEQKKPYQKPAFRYERVFETQALSCGKTATGVSGQCQSSRSAS
jgi:hypothetical protein